MKLKEGNLEFDFNNVIDGFKFDETNNTSPHYHGLTHCMKGVDFIVELKDAWLFIEIKDPGNPQATEERRAIFEEKITSGQLITELVQKYRDTFLYRWAEKKIDKPIKYVCLITLENALISKLMSDLKRQLPERKPNARWQQPIAHSCVVTNFNTWNHNFGQWPVSRVTP